MKLIALSDTHMKNGEIPENIQRIIEDCDLIIHAGDFSTKAAYEAFAATGKLKAVFGNTDEFEIKKRLPERLKFEVEGVKIGVVHEGGLSITDTTSQYYLAKEMDVDILIFGHLHRPLIKDGDVMLICPGSPTSPRMSEPTVVELIIENGSVSGRMITLIGNVCGFIKYQDSLKKSEEISRENQD